MTQSEGFAVPADRLTELVEWPQKHRKALIVFAVLFLGTFMCLLSVQEAQAAVPLIPILAAAAGVLGLGASAAGAAGVEWVKELLADGCNNALAGVLYNTLNFTGNAVDVDGKITGVFRNFDELVGPGSDLYENCIVVIHGLLINSVGYVIMCVCLVIGLAKVLQHAGQTEAGVNFWQLFLPFILFTAGVILISNSVEILKFPYVVMQQVADTIGTQITLGSGLNESNNVQDKAFISTENMDNLSTGTLFYAMIMLAVVWLGSFLISGIANVILILRGIQLYAYTAMSPIGLAFIVSDSTRPMATGFAKRYLAVVLSYLMIYLIFIMASFALSGIVVDIATNANWGSVDEVLGMQGKLLALLATTGALGFALLKSGAWSRELLGI